MVHIGWNSEGKRVVVDKSQNNERSIKAIIAATEAQTAAQTVSFKKALYRCLQPLQLFYLFIMNRGKKVTKNTFKLSAFFILIIT